MNLSRIPGLAAPVPPAAGPAAMVGQRPYMDYAGLPEQSMHELAVWSTAGGNGSPQPVTLTVKGVDDLLHWGEPFYMRRKYGYFETIDGQPANAPMSIDVEYDDGSTKPLQPADLEYALAAPDGGSEAITIGQEMQQAWGGRRQLTISYTEDKTTVSTQLTVMIGEPVTDTMKLRFKIGVEIPEEARETVIPTLEANRHISNASADYLNNDLLFDVDGNGLSIEPVASCFDESGHLMSGWLFKTGGDGRPTGVSGESIYLLRNPEGPDVDPEGPDGPEGPDVDPEGPDGYQSSPSYYITEVLSDPDQAWAVTDGDFRNGEFYGWTSLQYGLVEEPGASAYAENYRASQYNECSSLKGFKNADGEVVERPEEATGVTLTGDSVTSYRSSQFSGCSSLVTPLVEHSPIIDGAGVISGYRRDQYYSCSSLLTAADEDPLPAAEHARIEYFRTSQYSNCRSLTKSAVEHTYDMSGTVSAVKAGSSSFRMQQYGYCSSLAPAEQEKTIERIVSTGGYGTSTGTRFYKYDSTKSSDANPFYYQGEGDVPALQGDRVTIDSTHRITQFYMYGGAKSADKYGLKAHTSDSWKTTYTAGEELSLEGLSVDLTVNNKTVHTYTPPLPDGLTVTPPLGSHLNTSVTSVSVSYQYKDYGSNMVVRTNIPITVKPATLEA